MKRNLILKILLLLYLQNQFSYVSSFTFTNMQETKTILEDTFNYYYNNNCLDNYNPNRIYYDANNLYTFFKHEPNNISF